MVRKIFFILTLLLFIFSFNTCFASIPHDTITVDEADFILDFLASGDNMPSDAKEVFHQLSREAFVTSFNDNVAPKLGLKSGDYYLPDLEDLYFYYYNYDIYIVGEVTYDDHNTISVYPTAFNASKSYTISYEYGFYFQYTSLNSFICRSDLDGGISSLNLFYSNGSPSDPTYIGGIRDIVDTNCLGFLGNQYTSTFNLQEKSHEWYSVKLPVNNCYLGSGGDNPTPSGDNPTPSGDNPTPSGDTPTPSGDNSQLDYIAGGIDDINNNLTNVPDISGTIITSGDIQNSLDFDFTEDPYANFWLELNTGLSSALTSNNRTITINFRNEVYTISLDDFALQVPEFLKAFLAILSTSLIVWQIVRYIKIIIDKISSGDMDTVLAMNEEERNC